MKDILLTSLVFLYKAQIPSVFFKSWSQDFGGFWLLIEQALYF